MKNLKKTLIILYLFSQTSHTSAMIDKVTFSKASDSSVKQQKPFETIVKKHEGNVEIKNYYTSREALNFFIHHRYLLRKYKEVNQTFSSIMNLIENKINKEIEKNERKYASNIPLGIPVPFYDLECEAKIQENTFVYGVKPYNCPKLVPGNKKYSFSIETTVVTPQKEPEKETESVKMSISIAPNH